MAAWSSVHRLYSAYTGPLYQVRRTSDDALQDIPQLGDGYADASVQDAFCPDACTISILYDQSGVGNHLTASVPTYWIAEGLEADAKALPITAGGHPVYGVYVPRLPRIGQPRGSTWRLPTAIRAPRGRPSVTKMKASPP